MTDTQFQILDELYFLTSFADLANASGIGNDQLAEELEKLWETGWVRVYYPDSDTEVPHTPKLAGPDLGSCYFLASKAGLLAHNSQ